MKPEDKAILEHVVVNADEWDATQRAYFIKKYGQEKGSAIADANLAAKVARWRPVYEKCKAEMPVYKSRAERDADEAMARQAAEEAERAAVEEALREKIRAILNEELSKRGKQGT